MVMIHSEHIGFTATSSDKKGQPVASLDCHLQWYLAKGSNTLDTVKPWLVEAAASQLFYFKGDYKDNDAARSSRSTPDAEGSTTYLLLEPRLEPGYNDDDESEKYA